jgi:hypothetical protein
MTQHINDQVDQSLTVLGFNYRKDIINTTELRLNRAMHITHTNLFNAEQFQPQRAEFFSRQTKELKKLQLMMGLASLHPQIGGHHDPSRKLTTCC